MPRRHKFVRAAQAPRMPCDGATANFAHRLPQHPNAGKCKSCRSMKKLLDFGAMGIICCYIALIYKSASTNTTDQSCLKPSRNQPLQTLLCFRSTRSRFGLRLSRFWSLHSQSPSTSCPLPISAENAVPIIQKIPHGQADLKHDRHARESSSRYLEQESVMPRARF